MRIDFFSNDKNKYYVAEPVLAIKNIPTWYKEQESYTLGEKKPENGATTATIKKCMPVFDMMTAGYLIPLSCDIHIEPVLLETGEKGQRIQWSTGVGEIGFHSKAQLGKHPGIVGQETFIGYPKFRNPWSIKTPKGYSTLFMTPTHRESVFSIFSGIVDTDTFHVPVNFPFQLNDPLFEGTIPKGTFIAQLIPIKREAWQMNLGQEKLGNESKEQEKQLLSTFFDRYKNGWWQKKSYS